MKIKRTSKINVLLLTIGIFVSAGSLLNVYAAPKTDAGKPASESKKNYKPDELLVKFKPGAKGESRRYLHDKHGSKKIKEFSSLRLEHIKIGKGLTVEKAIAAYQRSPNVEYAEPNYIIKTNATIPDDLHFSSLWGLSNTGQTGGTAGADIQATAAWDVTTGDSSVIVAVIDSGVDYNHEDLAANAWVNSQEIAGNGIDDDANGYVDDVYGIDAINNDSDPMDNNGHGTHVSGTIGAVGNNGIGVAGVNWDVKILACKFLDASGSGYTSGAIECMTYIKALKDRGENIVASNNSWGCHNCYSQVLSDAIDAQRQSGILFVAAAGNADCDNDKPELAGYPASYDLLNIISVAATDHNDNRAYFSCYGRRSVDVGAPGVDILSSIPGNGYASYSGTSMASPHVAGLAALLQAQDLNRSWSEIKNLILTGGTDTASLNDITVTGKRISASGSVSCVDSPLFSVLQYPKHFEDYTVGTATILSVQSINCASPVGPVTATTSTGVMTNLLDDGVAPDVVANDGVFTANWIPTEPEEVLTFSSAIGTETLSVPIYVDLTVTEISGTLAGDQVTITATIKNIGQDASRSGYVSSYLRSVDGGAGAGLGYSAFAALAAGEETVLTITKSLGTDVNPDTYYVGMKVDTGYDPHSEFDETNNLLYSTTTISPSRDLTITAVSGSLVGNQLTVTTTVKNTGNIPARTTSGGVYLSADTVVDGSDFYLGTSTVYGLAADSERTLTITKTLDSSVTSNPGNYYIGVKADQYNRVAETDETNNTLASSTTVTVNPRPDLVADHVPGSVTGNALSATITIRNQGDVPASSSVAGIYLSTDTVITTADIFLGTQATAALAVGAEESVVFTANAPDTVPNGEYYIGVIANYDNAFLEQDTMNNVNRSGQILLQNQPLYADLTITALSATLVGEQLTITATVKNIGTIASVSTYVKSWLIAVDGSDSASLDYDSLISLEAGAETTLTITKVLWQTLNSGDYYVRMNADAVVNFNIESDETNNTLEGGLVTVP